MKSWNGNKYRTYHRFFILKFLFIPLFFFNVSGQNSTTNKEISFTINLRGISNSKITLSPYNEYKYGDPVGVKSDVTSGTTFSIPKSILPRQFLLRMDFRVKPADHPYPSELVVYLNDHDVELSVNPNYISADSLIFNYDTENPTWSQFVRENEKRRGQLQLLEQLLVMYEWRNSRFYSTTIAEYEKKRKEYNRWIDEQTRLKRDLFISHLFPFQKIPSLDWKLDANAFLEQKIHRFFDFCDLNDTLLLNTDALFRRMDEFMGLFGTRATSEKLRDSLFTVAGEIACEQASKGHPKIYGWMVDYFYRGYETYQIIPGMQMLQKHINNPNCLTAKRQEINRRVKGINTLKPGLSMPLFFLPDHQGNMVDIYQKESHASLRVLVFWSNDCGHCHQLLSELFDWWKKFGKQQLYAITTIDLSDKKEDWVKATKLLPTEATHLFAPGGVNSSVASEFFLLSTPVLFITSPEGKIELIPKNLEELKSFME